MWSSYKLDMSNLIVFGCQAHVHQKERKLKPRVIRCVFIGYPEGVKGYKLWLYGSGRFKVIISRDVVFNLNIVPCLKTNNADIEVQHKDGSVQIELEFQTDKDEIQEP